MFKSKGWMRAGWLALFAALALLAACAAPKHQMGALERLQYAYSAAIRWGDFEGAWMLVDPKYREANPMSDLELERYKQIQIDLVNRHTLTERTTRYTEHWHYEAESKTWWLVNGLPDLWKDG